MSVITGQPVVDGGVASVNFFNGRLLTGEDLSREQSAQTIARLRLGRTVGSGVACGFTVTAASASTPTRPVVHIEPGIAVNAVGRVLELTGGIELGLARVRTSAAEPDGLAFQDCTPPSTGTYVAGAGSYLLTVAPARQNVGRAATSGLGNLDAPCNVAYSVEGVVFQLLRLALPAAVTADPGRLRNRLAHHAFGTDDPRRIAADSDPLGPPAVGYGLLDDLRAAACLSPEQVPLAVLTWTASAGIVFVDVWSVRRRITAPPAATLLPQLTNDRAVAEGEAVFLQFQAQIAEAVASGEALGQVMAPDRFAHLPPVGIVPITRADGSGPGFDPDAFLGQQGSAQIALLDAAQVPALVREATAHRPVAVGGPSRIQRYLIRENDRDAQPGAAVRRVLVFAGAALPYRGVARYGYAHYGRDRYARL